MYVVLGDLDLNDTVPDGAEPIKVTIAEAIKHPNYTEWPVANDIALLRLNQSVAYSGECMSLNITN